MPDWRALVRKRLARSRMPALREAEIVEEMANHLEDRFRELIASGVTTREATQALRDELAGVDLNEFREIEGRELSEPRKRGNGLLSEFGWELRFAGRRLLKSPSFTLVAVLALALGIGANGAMFSIVHSVLLKALPYESADSLVMLWGKNGRSGESRLQVSPSDFEDLRRLRSFQSAALFRGRSRNLTGGDQPERVIGSIITPGLFGTIGVAPFLGRDFLGEEDQPGATKVVMLSHGLWQRRFGGDATLVGRQVMLDNEPHTVIGIMPKDFWFFGLSQAEVWTPLAIPKTTTRDSRFMEGVARIKPGVTLAQAQAEVNATMRRLAAEYPQTNSAAEVELAPLRESLVGPSRAMLLVFWGAMGIVLLIAGANVATLLIVRGCARQRELAISLALGATRRRVLVQSLSEGLLLGLLGAGSGLAIAMAAQRALVRFSPIQIPRLETAAFGWEPMGFTLLLATLLGLMCGVISALQATGDNSRGALQESARARSAGPRQRRWMRALVVAEIALTCILLCGAGLLVATYDRLSAVDPGFRSEGVLTLQMIPRANYPRLEQQTAFLTEVLERTKQLPGVEAVAEINFLPLTDSDAQGTFTLIGKPAPQAGETPVAHLRAVSHGYFGLTRIPMLLGRDLTADEIAHPRSVVINRAAHDRFWRGENPIGQQIRYQGRDLTVIGVVENVKHASLRAGPQPELYLPYSLDGFSSLRSIVMRSRSDSKTLAAAARRTIWDINRNQTVFHMVTLDEIVAESLARPRFSVWLMSAFAAAALGLAVIGIYGITAYLVSQQRHEIGVRVALGARRGQILGRFIGEGVALALVGLTVGLTGALWLTRLMRGLLYGIAPGDPLILTSVSLILFFVTVAACYLPARSANAIDPAEVLRRG